jgi:SAM-dependent methyltransferase
MSAWYQDESFWRHGFPFMFSEEAFARGAQAAERALALSGVEARLVLDLCCGPGRHTVPLALKGIEVTAVDLSPFLLERAKENARKANVAPEFVLADMRTFVRPNTFDLALNLFTSFGYFEQRDEDRTVLANVHESLRPGGAFVMDMMGKEIVARGWGTKVDELPDGSVWVQRPQIVEDWTRMKHHDIFIANGSVLHFEFTHRIYSGQELRDLMLSAGFEDVSLFGDLEGHPYGPGATRLVAVGRKAST